MTNRLEIKSASKVFKKKIALHPFSLKVAAGECIALCGGNGAGKSTLLHILAGISSPGEGTVIIEDVDLLKNRKRYVSLIGYMPDEFYAQETLTVQEFLCFYGSFRNIPQTRIMEVIRILGLEEKKHEMVKHLSKGMRQRLLFGQAWAATPAVLILDEPTNGLDPYWIDVFITLLKDIKNSGSTIIFSTHMMDVASEVADRVLFMEDGKLVTMLKNDHINTNKFMVDLLHLYRKQQ
ncbi:ABC transporter ATP-binding protein [Bacillus sp. EB106-08-02-XG196]|jgi:ABC-2 type transport system ATP-binding protein|uniref:ABC transporter ATP-binding protein n=1 Tax=Bacillus sp. EB106-08-02-XG196 TaxID=2737049 RepID=UPI0015C47E24|nr:ABC transporter ATP-binding protein [Bacillus sp. EB106-08-02-XG196]NWQ42395.1 ABC transporter ATP-binding protein [Bacillus sp. EB106-08-02-XG196]